MSTTSVQRTAVKKPKKPPTSKGRPTKYRDEFPEVAYEVCKQYGSTDRQLGKIFGVKVDTIWDWKTRYPTFKQRIKDGKDLYDSDRVESALLKSAVGFRYTETKTERVPFLIGGKRFVFRDKVTTTKKLVTPNVKAQMYWLSNRNKDRWDHPMKHNDQSDPFRGSSSNGKTKGEINPLIINEYNEVEEEEINGASTVGE